MSPETPSAVVLRRHRALLALSRLDMSDFEAALPTLLERAADALDAETATYWHFEDERSRLTCTRRYSRIYRAFSTAADRLAAEAPQDFALLTAGMSIRFEEPREALAAGHALARRGALSALELPVWQRREICGVFSFEHHGQPRRWTDDEVEFASSVVELTATSLELHSRRRAEKRYELLTTALQDLVWDWDLRSDEIAWTEAALSVLRYYSPDVETSLAWWKAQVHPDDLSRVMEGLRRHLAEGTGVWRDEYRFQRGDGSWAIILDRGVIERSEDGTPVRMIGAMHDVTEQRRLESRVAVSDRMASVGTLAAGMAHEINNPLTYIHGNLTFAINHLTPGTTQLHQALGEALTGVERVQRIVKDLKAFSRPDEQPSRVDVREVIFSALNIAQNEIRHRARLRESHHEVPPVLGNAARLSQVVLNLLVNAAQAIPAGRSEENEITVRTRALPGNRVRIEVEDTGVGIPPELLNRLFDPFFTTKPIGEGTGLGLSICHALVTSMGGTLTLENNPGRGALARVDLLAASTVTSAPAPDDPVRQGAGRRGKVLIIDDTPNVCLSMQRLLAEEHDVDTTTRAREALEWFAQGRRWDVILCDLMMPELGGMDLVSETEKVAPEILPRIVMMSGGAFTRAAQEFLHSWPHGQLEKPIHPDQLFAEIRRRVEGGEPAAAALR